MSRQFYFLLVVLTALILLAGRGAYGQTAAPGISNEPSLGNEPLGTNSFEPPPVTIAPNKIVQPLPLTASERDAALDGIDRHVADEVTALKEKLNKLLPDELSVLAKTAGWSADKQNALIVALRSVDPAAVYKAWSQGNPQDTAGAELVARQTQARSDLAKLEQDVQQHQAINDDLADLETALTKIAPATPGVADLTTPLNTLKTLAEVRKFVSTAVPEKGPTARLPNGRVKLIFEPDLPIGQAVVLGNGAVMIGNEGRGTLSIATGNAAEALGLPLVTGEPLPDAQGPDTTTGILLMNPPDSKTTVSYNLNGNTYVMQPGMVQRITDLGRWVVTYDQGENHGLQSYTVTDGTYWFTPTDHGLQLYRERFEIALDNSKNPQEFNAIVNGQKLTVPANATRTISSPYPMLIRYDRGNGERLAAKALNFGGNVEIGVNAADNLWDLFPTTNGQREVKTMRLFQ